MRGILVLFGCFLLITENVSAETKLTGKQIFQLYRGAIVEIWMNNNFSGTGFLTSADGLVVTANHVVTTRESNFREFGADIKIFVAGKPTPYSAIPMPQQEVESRINYDSVVLKIEGHGFQHLSMGDWNDVDIEDEIFILPTFHKVGTMLLKGIVSEKGQGITVFGTAPVNMMILQCPVRNGFSGAPIFSSSGLVVGIIDTKVFGISDALDGMRQRVIASNTGNVRSNIVIYGVDMGQTLVELIDVLDNNVISGLGSGVTIGYAKEICEKTRK